MESNFTPNINFAIPHPGNDLQELLIEKALTPEQLAEQTGLNLQSVLAVLSFETPVTPEMADAFACVYQTSARLWLARQSQYDVWRAALANTTTV